MNERIETLRSELAAQLQDLAANENNRERAALAMQAIDIAINKLNEIAGKLQFATKEEEIYFFKHVKPEILACRIEEVMRYNLDVNVPIGTNELKLKYYEDELRARQSYFRLNAFHYQYYKNGLSDLDHLYFRRDAAPLAMPVDEIAEYQSEFSTPLTYLFAKFIAYEHIQYYILQQIALLKYPESQLSRIGSTDPEIKWTGDSVNIVELAYGIWLTGQLNNGNASLNQIVRWLEANLHISIGIIQRRFSEIERRKRLSPTRYIDQMKEAILQKIENGNS
jgi:hypothetical protein